MDMIKRNKKASGVDLVVYMITGFIMAIVFVILFWIGTTFHTKLLDQADSIQEVLGDSGNATQIIEDSVGKASESYQSLKWITAMLLIGMALSILITSFFVRTYPIFFVAYLIILIVSVLISVPISNTYETIYKDPVLASSFQGFYGQNWIFLHLPLWISVVGIMAGVLMVIGLIRSQSNQYG